MDCCGLCTKPRQTFSIEWSARVDGGPTNQWRGIQMTVFFGVFFFFFGQSNFRAPAALEDAPGIQQTGPMMFGCGDTVEIRVRLVRAYPDPSACLEARNPTISFIATVILTLKWTHYRRPPQSFFE